MNPLARKTDICVEQLQSETILYDKSSHKAHCLNKTSFIVWENADGKRSIDEIAHILGTRLETPVTPEIVELALQELETANLLVKADLPQWSRRQIGKRLAIAGVSASLLPLVASIAAPTPAMARSYTLPTYEKELLEVGVDVLEHQFTFDKNPAAQRDLAAGIHDGALGAEAVGKGNKSAASAHFEKAENEFDDLLKALNLPPL